MLLKQGVRCLRPAPKFAIKEPTFSGYPPFEALLECPLWVASTPNTIHVLPPQLPPHAATQALAIHAALQPSWEKKRQPV